MKCISEFLKENYLSLNTVPLVMCGDLNSKPDSSPVHYLMNKKYLMTDERTDSKTGILAYRDQSGISKFQAVQTIMD